MKTSKDLFISTFLYLNAITDPNVSISPVYYLLAALVAFAKLLITLFLVVTLSPRATQIGNEFDLLLSV